MVAAREGALRASEAMQNLKETVDVKGECDTSGKNPIPNDTAGRPEPLTHTA
jgi:hypothetical protein